MLFLILNPKRFEENISRNFLRVGISYLNHSWNEVKLLSQDDKCHSCVTNSQIKQPFKTNYLIPLQKLEANFWDD